MHPYCESCKDDFCINNIISEYVSNVESLFHSFAISIEALNENHKKMVKRLEKMAGCEKKEKPESNEVELAIECSYKEFKKLKKTMYNITRAKSIIPRTFIVSVVSEYDAFVGRMTKVMYYLNPEKLNNSDRKFSFSELMGFESIGDAKAFMIEKEVETLLRKSHKEQLEVLGRKFDVELTKDVVGWKEFIEITERRNLFVHCDGIVSSHYLAVCLENSIDISNCKKGDVLTISPEYLLKAYQTFVVMGVMLGHVLWRKFIKCETDLADNNLMDLMYDNLNKLGKGVACDIGRFSIECIKRFSNDVTNRIVKINYAIALKMSKRDKEAEKVLSGLDWSATSLNFKLAVAVLRGEYVKACEFMRAIGARGEVSKANYIEWPLFWEFRETQLFADCYNEVFGEEFDKLNKDRNAPVPSKNATDTIHKVSSVDSVE